MMSYPLHKITGEEMKKVLVIAAMTCVVGLSGCTSLNRPDPGTERILGMRLQSMEQEKSAEKRVTIEVISADGKKYPLEVIKNAKGEFVIPIDAVKTRYELSIESK